MGDDVLRLATSLSMRRRRVTEEHAPGAFMGTGPYHAAAIFAHKECVLAYGENRFVGVEGRWTEHAERAAISKLPSRPRRRRLDAVDMLVIRTSKTGLFGNSRPCLHCILCMAHDLPERGYRLRRVYYFDDQRAMRETGLDTLCSEPPHVSVYYRNRGMVARGPSL